MEKGAIKRDSSSLTVDRSFGVELDVCKSIDVSNPFSQFRIFHQSLYVEPVIKGRLGLKRPFYTEKEKFNESSAASQALIPFSILWLHFEHVDKWSSGLKNFTSLKCGFHS